MVYYKKKRNYRRRKRPYRKRGGFRRAVNKVIKQNQETRRMLPIDGVVNQQQIDGLGTDGLVAYNQYGTQRVQFGFNSSYPQYGYILPAVVNNNLGTNNREGKHAIEGDSIQPVGLSLKCSIQTASGTAATRFGQLRMLVLKTKNVNYSVETTTTIGGSNILPPLQDSSTSLSNALYNRINTDDFWILKDQIINLNQISGTGTGDSPTVYRNYKFYWKLYKTMKYDTDITGSLDSKKYPNNSILVVFYWNNATDTPLIDCTYSLRFKDS